MTERSAREELHLAIMAWWTFTAAPNRCECFIFWYLSNENPELEGKSGICCISFLLTVVLPFSISWWIIMQQFRPSVPSYIKPSWDDSSEMRKRTLGMRMLHAFQETLQHASLGPRDWNCEYVGLRMYVLLFLEKK